MRKILLSIAPILLTIQCFAQGQLAFPFQGGKEAMANFFRQNLVVSPEIIQKKAFGTAVLKFSADEKGAVSKIVVYYADDYMLAAPAIDALRKSDRKWIIPDREKTHDLIISFIFGFNQPQSDSPDLQKVVYDNYRDRHPIVAMDQVPLDEVTLLPPVAINYDILQ